jgi:CHAD domain-containing protein
LDSAAKKTGEAPAGGGGGRTTAPAHAAPIGLDPDWPVAEAARRSLDASLGHVAANLEAVSLNDDPEGAHQLRIGLRRLRAVLALYGKSFDRLEVMRLRGETGWLNSRVGALRDLHVVRDDMAERARAAGPDQPGLMALAERLARLAERTGAEVRPLLQGARVRVLLKDLAALREQAPTRRRPGESLLRFADDALRDRFAAIRRKSKGLKRRGAAGRHRFRRRLRKFRDMAELLASLYPAERVAPFLERMKACLDSLGKMSDIVVVEALLEDNADDGATHRAAASLRRKRARRGDRAWTKARRRWRRLRATEPFWED